MMSEATVIFLAVFLFFSGCDQAGNLFGDKQQGRPHKAPKGGIQSIVISESVPMYASADDTQRQMATLSLGETVFWTRDSLVGEEGDTAIFLNTILSDGTSGWVRRSALVRDAQAAAIKSETRVYRRPDTLTLTDLRLPFMSVVAITDRTDDWAQVIGEDRSATGWIRRDVITEEKEEVATAIFARQKIISGKLQSRTALLKEIIFNAPYAESYFIEQLRHMRSLENLFHKDKSSRETIENAGMRKSEWFALEKQSDTAESD